MLFAKKCPLCSAKMTTVNGVLTCPDCGYKESFHNSSYTTSDSAAAANTHTNTSENSRSYYQTPNAASGSPHGQSNLRPYEQYLNQQQNGNSTSGQSFAEITAQNRAAYEDKKLKSLSRAVLICIALILVFIAIFVPITLRFFNSSRHEDSTYASKKDKENTSRADSEHSSANAGDSDKELSLKKIAPAVPHSDFFGQTVCYIFNKELDDISPEDMAQIISLHVYEINYDYEAVDYVLADGTSGTVYPVSQRPDVSEDLTCFVNLEELYLEDSYGDLNLKGLDKLHTLYVDEDIRDITETISASRITSLGLYDVSFSLSGLSAFENVESLYLDSSMLTDISGIAELPNLKSLTIVDGDYIDNLSALYGATQLESLYIESNTLRDVNFLTAYENLTELTIIGSKVLDFNPLAECTKLKKLYLLENYETTDYDFLKDMTELTELGLITSFDFDDSNMPDFSALTNVTKLHLGNFESFDNLKYMTNVEELIIDDGGYGDFGSSNALLSLPKLRSLTLINSSVSPEMLKQISEAENLEYLDLYSSYLWGSINPILSMPNLKELNLRYASFMLEPERLSPNETLRVLNLNNAIISKYNADQWATNESLSAEKLQEALANFHGMETLMIEKQQLNSVEFAENMENLKFLNITDNYVVSLAPLANLTKIQAIIGETNPISDTAGLDDILVME